LPERNEDEPQVEVVVEEEEESKDDNFVAPKLSKLRE